MNKKVLALVLLCHAQLGGVSFVYNFRIAETTRRRNIRQMEKHPHVVAAILISQFRATRHGIKQSIVGPLLTFMRAFECGYFRIDTSGGYIKQNISIARTKRKRGQTDDILLMAGYGCPGGKDVHFTISGLLGIPTHKDTVFEGVQFGTGHVGLGAQLDGSWFYANEGKNAIMGAARYIHFLPRNVHIPINNVSRKFSFHLGNVVDLLIGHVSNGRRWNFEFGYNPTFAWGAHLKPKIPALDLDTSFIRSNFYANYKYLFLIGQHPSGLGIGFSYGFDHKPKNIGFKRIITLWAAWGINF